MKVIANTTVISNFASVGRLDLLQALLGEVFISSGVYDEIQDGLQEGYDFYSDLENLVYPFSEEGWLRLTSLEGEDELKMFVSHARLLRPGSPTRSPWNPDKALCGLLLPLAPASCLRRGAG